MNLFRRAKDAGRGAFARIWSQAPRSETTRLPAMYHQTPRLDPIDLIASTIASSELQLFDRATLRKNPDDAAPLSAHPMLDLLESPTTMFTELDGYALKYITAVFVELLGEAFWVKVRSSSAKIDELLPFPPAWCISTPTAQNASFLFQPFGTTSGKTLQVAPADVVWFKQPDMTDPFGRGRGRTEAVGGELDSDEMAERWQRNYFYNDATPPFWANVPGAQSADLERLRDTWAQRLGGWLNARKPAFTNSDSLQIVKLGETVKEMDFVETRRFLRDVFNQHFSIPPEMFGILESSNRSTIDSAYYLFAKNVISRRLGFYERVITRQLVAPDYDNRLVAKFDFEVPEDETFVLQKVNEGFSRGALTRADWKRAMGYKVEPGDDVYILPYSMTVVPKGEAPAPKDEPAPEDVIDIIEPEKIAKGADMRQAHWKAADNRAREGEGMFRARTRAFADVQSARVRKELKSRAPDQYRAGLDEAFSGADEALVHAYAPAWIASMTDGAEIGRSVLGKKISPSFTLYNRAFDAWVKKNGLIKAKEINTTTYDALRAAIDESLAEGIAAGESVPKLSARVQDACDGVYDDMRETRATMIARTETMASVNFGQQIVYEDEGVQRKAWLATPDSDTRDAHADADGMTVGIHEAFSVGGEELEYPGDPSGSAGNVINCRCTVLPVLED